MYFCNNLRMYIGAYCNAPGKQGSFMFFAPFRCALRPCFVSCQARLTVRPRESQHNPALKYAPDGRKMSHGLMGAAAAAVADRNYPPPDVALCRVFRAQEQGSFAQVGRAAACCCPPPIPHPPPPPCRLLLRQPS